MASEEEEEEEEIHARSRSNGSTVSRYFISGEIGGYSGWAKTAGRPICKHKGGSPGMKLARYRDGGGCFLYFGILVGLARRMGELPFDL